MSGRKPIRVFYSELTGRFYATAAYRIRNNGVAVITGKKYDVTNDIGAAVERHEIEFTRAPESETQAGAGTPREEP